MTDKSKVPTPETDAAVEYFPVPPDGEPQPFVPVHVAAGLEHRNAELERALWFYANQDTYMGARTGGVLKGCPRGEPAIRHDKGRLARETLAATAGNRA